MIGRERYYPAHPLQLAGRALTEASKGRGDLVKVGRRLLRDVADLSDSSTADLTLVRRAEVVLQWIAAQADPAATPATRRAANEALERLDTELTAEDEAAEDEDGDEQ